MPYALLPHTADVKVALWASDRRGLYGVAVGLVRDLTVAEGEVEARATVVVPPEGDDDGERFFRFVRELFYLYDADGFVPGLLIGWDPPAVSGEAFDPRRHAPRYQVKAVTRHHYTFARTPDGYRAEIVLDL